MDGLGCLALGIVSFMAGAAFGCLALALVVSGRAGRG
jgi:hypothetical protein